MAKTAHIGRVLDTVGIHPDPDPTLESKKKSNPDPDSDPTVKKSVSDRKEKKLGS